MKVLLLKSAFQIVPGLHPLVHVRRRHRGLRAAARLPSPPRPLDVDVRGGRPGRLSLLQPGHPHWPVRDQPGGQEPLQGHLRRL